MKNKRLLLVREEVSTTRRNICEKLSLLREGIFAKNCNDFF